MTVAEIVPQDTRYATALRVQQAYDVPLPPITGWNSEPCSRHEYLSQGCSNCGVVLHRHQRVGASWLYFVEKGLLGDTVGAGKTHQISALIGLIRDKGELEEGKVIIICRALLQWQTELARVLPTLRTVVALGTPDQRIQKYLNPWDVMLMTHQMLPNDMDLILRFPVSLVVADDVDAIRHSKNKTAVNMKRLAKRSRRVVIVSGTPLQKQLLELYHVLAPVGGYQFLGSERAFSHRFIVEDSWHKPIAYSNLPELKQRIAPLVLRRTVNDIDDVNLPAVVPENYFLELYPSQRRAYTDLQRGIVRLIKEEGSTVKRFKAIAKFSYGAGICAGLVNLGEPDGPGMSVKFDWVIDQLTSDLEDEKVVLFCNRKGSIQAMQNRLRRLNIGFETIWGNSPSKQERHASQQRFWNDDSCRVLMGTSALEQSLNLQCARHLINLDSVLNAARMTQLSGRIRRDGSKYKTVYVHSLFASDTQEERYLPLLEREAALANYVWDEPAELFNALSPLAMLSMITG